MEGWGTGEASWNNIKRVDFFNENPDHCFDWYIALSRLISDRWQLSFEGFFYNYYYYNYYYYYLLILLNYYQQFYYFNYYNTNEN